jgi:hypothetical protein
MQRDDIMNAYIILHTLEFSAPPSGGPPVAVGRPRPVLDPYQAKLLCDPPTAGAGFTLAQLSRGSGLDLIRVVLEAVVSGSELRQIRERRRQEPRLAVGLEIPVGGPASLIRVEVGLSNVSEQVLAWLRHLIDAGEITLQPVVEYGKLSHPRIMGWCASFAFVDWRGDLIVHGGQRGLHVLVEQTSA